jgi:hypothetical protein
MTVRPYEQKQQSTSKPKKAATKKKVVESDDMNVTPLSSAKEKS